jgi:hypothetical protein
MKLNRQIVVALVIMVAMSALYRVLPGRPLGFAPQIAIALAVHYLQVKNNMLFYYHWFPCLYLMHCIRFYT